MNCYIVNGHIDNNVELGEFAREKYNSFHKPDIAPITTIEVYVKDGVRYEIEKTPDGTMIEIRSRLVSQP